MSERHFTIQRTVLTKVQLDLTETEMRAMFPHIDFDDPLISQAGEAEDYMWSEERARRVGSDVTARFKSIARKVASKAEQVYGDTTYEIWEN